MRVSEVLCPEVAHELVVDHFRVKIILLLMGLCQQCFVQGFRRAVLGSISCEWGPHFDANGRSIVHQHHRLDKVGHHLRDVRDPVDSVAILETQDRKPDDVVPEGLPVHVDDQSRCGQGSAERHVLLKEKARCQGPKSTGATRVEVWPEPMLRCESIIG